MQDNRILKAARYYLEKQGFSIIPILPPHKDQGGADDHKRPPIKWEPYQNQKPTVQELDAWFQNPACRLAIVTGKINNLCVIDCDSEEAKGIVEYHLADSAMTPMARSPRGGYHFYFLGNDLPCQSNIMPKIDIRGEGGYIIAPPSNGVNGNGYSWVKGLGLHEVNPIPIPSSLYLAFKELLTSSRYNIKNASTVPQGQISALNFEQGSRDQTLFHIANCLVKGRMPEQEIEQLLTLVSTNICNPPFSQKEVWEKVKSAMKRQNSADRNLTEEVREWVMSTSGHFLSTDVHKEFGLSTRVHKKNVSMILARLCEDGLIEKWGDKKGSFRTIDRTFKEQEWWKDSGQPLSIKFPLGISDFVKIYAGNVILLEGQKSQGKSAFALEVCRMNRRLFGSQKILYQNVEMADSELLDRFRSYGDVMSLDEWKESVIFIRQTENWWDKVSPDSLNVIDYLIEYEKSYLIAEYIWKIHQKLKSGIAIVIIQRDPLKPYGHGGRSVRDIPRAIISLIKHKVRLEDVKSFYHTSYGNPTGLCRKYKQVNWWEFRPDSEWDFEEETKYDKFRK